MRTHVSEGLIDEVRPTPDVGASMKPAGFWYEVDGDWQRWCASEQPDWIEGHMLYAVDLGQTNVLKIETLEALDGFDREYGTIDGYRPDWRRLAERYDGLEIAPYQWERRLSRIGWYYPWDCASGVIWRPKGVTLSLLQQSLRVPAEVQ